MNEFEPFTEIEKIICNYIFNKNFEERFVLFEVGTKNNEFIE